MEINKEIFRQYDIRGIYPTQINEEFATIFGKCFGTHIKKNGKTKCVIGHDNRLSSPTLADALITGITSTGIDVVYLDLTTTPMYYYACDYLDIDCGVMVTASHNPKDDNGFKFTTNSKHGNDRGDEIINMYNEILEGNFSSGKGSITIFNIAPYYYEFIKKKLSFGKRKLKVVIDPANGAPANFCRKIYEQFPIELTIINEESDGSFPNHHPDPCIEDNLTQLKETVLKNHADVGLSYDGDGDRIGVITNSGRFIAADIYMILIIRDIINKVDKKEFLYDVKCSKALSDEIDKLGAKGLCYRTGASYTKAKVKDDDLPFGGELAGHIYFRDKWPGIDCGMYAGLRLLEILSKTNKTLDELLEGINKYYSTPEIKVTANDNIKFQVVNKIKEYVKEKGYKYIDIDGVRVNYEDGFSLIRASNTGPNITMRFEAKTKERLDEIQKEFMSILHKAINELK